MRMRLAGLAILLVALATPASGSGFGFEPFLTKSFSPTSILDGGVTVLTFTITSDSGAPPLSDIGFLDTLPANLRLANATVGGTCANAAAATAVASGGTTVTVTALQVPGGGAACTVTVNVTNVTGQLNASCTGNPAAFTNSQTNVTNRVDLAFPGLTPSCVVVSAAVPVLPPWMRIVLAFAVVAAAGLALRRSVGARA